MPCDLNDVIAKTRSEGEVSKSYDMDFSPEDANSQHKIACANVHPTLTLNQGRVIYIETLICRLAYYDSNVFALSCDFANK